MTRYDIRTYGDLEGEDRSDLAGQIGAQRKRVAGRLAEVDRVLAVMSGKGGVGKSFVAAGLAVALSRGGRSVGLVDADLQGPTAARMLGAPRESLSVTGEGVTPASSPSGVALMSAELLLDREAPLEWRGPEEGRFAWQGAQERGMLMEFLGDVVWGGRDWLLVDLPPGSRRLNQLAELVTDLHGVVAVTLPGGASRSSVARSMELASRRGIPLAGIVENMAGYACRGCGSLRELFPGRAGQELAARFEVPLLARLPFDPEAARLADDGQMGRLLGESPVGPALVELANALGNRTRDRTGEGR